MQVTKITATPRTDNGKNACRRIRAAGKLPAITYGLGSEAQGLIVSPEEVVAILTSPKGKNSVVELDVAGKSVTAMIHEYQYHPVTRKLLHADFVQVNESSKVKVTVPLRITGKSKGVTMGGKLRQVFRELPVECAPSQIPAELVIDITNLELEQSIKVGALELPEGVTVLLGEKRTVVAVIADRRAKKDEEEAAAKPDGKK